MTPWTLWSLCLVCLAVFGASREWNLRREEDLAARRVRRIVLHLRRLRSHPHGHGR